MVRSEIGGERGRRRAGEAGTTNNAVSSWSVDRGKKAGILVEVPGQTKGLGVSTGRRFMWLLIESFSLDRAALLLALSRNLFARSSLLFPSFALFSLCASLGSLFFYSLLQMYAKYSQQLELAFIFVSIHEWFGCSLIRISRSSICKY